MSARRLLGAGLVACSLGCAGSSVRPDDDGVTRALGGPVARGLVATAPEAWVEVLREADRARGLAGAERADAEVELALSLEWAQAVAERGAAERALAAATSQRAGLVEEQSRLDAEIARLEQATRASAAAQAQAREAQRAAHAPGAVDVARRAAVAAELDQQTELLLAAGELIGARPEAVQPLRARLGPARPGVDRLTAAAAVYRDAANLLDATRAAGTAVSTADVDALRLQASLSDTDGVDAHRDERGVVAVLRGLFAGPRVSPTARSRVEMLGRVIRSHGALPVRVECFVGGASAGASVALARAQSTALRAALVAAGVPAERLQAAGYHRLPGGARTEDRVEVVLLSPRAE